MSTILSAKQPAPDKGAHVSIPFFDNLPIAAIPATQRLYDEVSTPGHNALTAYSNFVSRLNSAGADVPPRAIVKRWVAGVQAGLITRPESHFIEVVPSSPEPNYFESLPAAAMSALAQLWDEVQASTGSNDEEAEDEKAFDSFFEAIRAIGHREPEWKLFVAYARAIRAGQVERPARQIGEEDARPADAATERKSAKVVTTKPADVLLRHPHMRIPVLPDITTAMDETTGLLASVTVTVPDIPADERPAREPADRDDIARFVDRMLDDTIVQLQREARARAALLVAGRLRELADQLDRVRP